MTGVATFSGFASFIMYTVYTFIVPSSATTVMLAVVLSSVNLYSINPSIVLVTSSRLPDKITLSVPYGTVKVYTVTSLSKAISKVPTLAFNELKLLLLLIFLITLTSVVKFSNSSIFSFFAMLPLNVIESFPSLIAVNSNVNNTSSFFKSVPAAPKLLSLNVFINFEFYVTFVNFRLLPVVS